MLNIRTCKIAVDLDLDLDLRGDRAFFLEIEMIFGFAEWSGVGCYGQMLALPTCDYFFWYVGMGFRSHFLDSFPDTLGGWGDILFSTIIRCMA